MTSTQDPQHQPPTDDSQSTADVKAIKASAKRIITELLKFYDMKVDLSGLLEAIPVKEHDTQAQYLNHFLTRLGFSTTTTSVDQLDLTRVDRPHIITADEDTYALAMPGQIYKKDRSIFGVSNKAASHLQNAPYSGEIIVIDQSSPHIADYIAHMKTGHALDWFWQPILRYRRHYYDIVLASVFINLLVLAVPLYSLNIYDRVVIHFIEETLLVLTFGVIIALMFDFFFKNIRTYVLERLAERLGRDYDFKLMERLMHIPAAHIGLSVGEQSNVFRELQSIREFYASRLVPTVIDFPFILLFLGIIYGIGGILVVVPVITIVLILLINFLVHFPISRLMEEYFSSIQNKASYLIETLNGMPAMQMFNARGNRLFHWDRTVAKSARLSRHNAVMLSALSNLTFMLSQVCHVVMVCMGVYLIHDTTMTIGGLITCSILSGRAIAPAMSLSALIARLKQSEDVLKAVDKVFNLPHFDQDALNRSAKGPFKGALTLNGLSFTYPGQTMPALQDITLSIPAGTHVGIIGQSAAGKSTLAQLLGHHLIPQHGSITLDGFDLNTLAHTELSRTITYAPQDPVFFKGTLSHNITLGRSDITEAAVKQAVEISGLGLVLQQNGQGLDMDVLENGANLSGGQKQAISLARAIARNPKVMIFDEPTTGMDNRLEAHLQHRLSAYLKDRTFIMITHRTPLLGLVDHLILLDKGRLLADGPKAQVLEALSGSKAGKAGKAKT